MSLLQARANVKKGQSIHKKMIKQAQKKPDRIIAYIESLLEKVPCHVLDDGNLLSHLYRVAQQARSRSAMKSV